MGLLDFSGTVAPPPPIPVGEPPALTDNQQQLFKAALEKTWITYPSKDRGLFEVRELGEATHTEFISWLRWSLPMENEIKNLSPGYFDKPEHRATVWANVVTAHHEGYPFRLGPPACRKDSERVWN